MKFRKSFMGYAALVVAHGFYGSAVMAEDVGSCPSPDSIKIRYITPFKGSSENSANVTAHAFGRDWSGNGSIQDKNLSKFIPTYSDGGGWATCTYYYKGRADDKNNYFWLSTRLY